MKKVVVTTTVQQKTTAIEKLENLKDWTLIVVGDKKTPKNYSVNGIYLSPDDQDLIDPSLSETTGWNCVQRRNFGFIEAYKIGADIIASVDDDNIPMDHWGVNVRIGQETTVKMFHSDLIAFDPIGATNYKNLWHRGFPLELLPLRNYPTPSSISIVPDIQADFWNGDPDIDAICRLEHRPECVFNEDHFPFTTNTLSPFNSQNTFISRSVLKNYFMFPFIGRMDDIWASYYLEATGAKVIYEKPSVYQLRNPHNLITDMKNEYIGYENNLNLLYDLTSSPNNIKKYLPGKSIYCFELYQKHFK